MAIPRKDSLLAPYATNWHTRIETGYATFALTSAQAAAFEAVYTPYIDAQTALDASRASGTQAKQLTSDRNTAKEAMLVVLRELYTLVQASLTVSDGNKDLLGVKVKSFTPTPRPAPGAVSNFKALINGNGSLTVTWKADNPPGASGTMYMLWRKVGTGEFAFVGGCGEKKYTDLTIPAGATNICYQIQAVRSTVVGPWAQFNVNFGLGGSSSATVTEGTPVKLAA